jgi:DNA repair exonuclease SbcCD ATPase subunit
MSETTNTTSLEELSQDPVLMVETKKLKVIDQPMPKLDTGILLLLENSIKEFGIKIPIRISSDYTIIDGRNRYAIAIKLKMDIVPCIISDTKSNPLEHVLKYDLELGRRAILPDERSKLLIKRNKYYKQCAEESIESCLAKIIPEMHDTAKKIYEVSRNISIIMSIAAQPKEVQEAFIKEIAVVVDDKLNGNFSEEIKRLSQAEIDLTKELESTKIAQDKTLKEYEDLKTQFAKLQGDMKADIEIKLKAKEKELEQKYKASSSEEIQELTEKIQSDVREQYDNEINDLHEKLQDMSRSLSDKSKRQEELTEELAKLGQCKKDLELTNQNLNNKIGSHQNVIVGLARPDKFAKRLEMTFNDLNNTFTGLLETGFDGFDGYFTEHMQKTLEKIKDITAELEKLFQKMPGAVHNANESLEKVRI